MLIRNLLWKAKNRFADPERYGYNDYDNRECYYQNLLTERSGEALLHWLRQGNEAIVNARIQVSFRHIAFQSSPQEVRKLLGKPRFVIANPMVAGHEIYFYRFRVARMYSVAALHFLDHALFMANHTFRQLTAGNYQQLVEVLADKYGLLPPPKSIAVKDQHGNTVLMTDGLYLTVKYVSGHPAFSERIHQLLEEKSQYQQQQRFERTVSLSDFL